MDFNEDYLDVLVREILGRETVLPYLQEKF